MERRSTNGNPWDVEDVVGEPCGLARIYRKDYHCENDFVDLVDVNPNHQQSDEFRDWRASELARRPQALEVLDDGHEHDAILEPSAILSYLVAHSEPRDGEEQEPGQPGVSCQPEIQGSAANSSPYQVNRTYITNYQ